MVTINELYNIISNTLKKELKPKYLPERQGDIKHSLADIKNMEKINYEVSSHNFETQIEETVTWFKENMWPIFTNKKKRKTKNQELENKTNLNFDK